MSFWGHQRVTRREFEEAITQIERKLMSTQADVDALTAQVTQVATDLQTAQTTLQTEIDNLAAANPALDLSALQAAVAPLDASVQALGAITPTPPPAP
jgi:DNA-directed RNA polymerase specialized sigma54-like protein